MLNFSLLSKIIIIPVLLLSACETSHNDVSNDPWNVKVAVVIQNPMIDGKRAHEVLNTPGRDFVWNNPWELNEVYRQTLEELSAGTVEYEIVEIIDSDKYFTYLRESNERLTEERVIELLQEPNWQTLRDEGSRFDYHAFVEYYGFDEKRDADEVHEVWVWTFPYAGMWESHMMGEGAFWLNSHPAENPTCTEKLVIMGLNYERDLACALESYGHRFESVLMEVYGWWDYDNKNHKDELTTWELYAAYGKVYDKFEPGKAHIGNLHFGPNSQFDYDWRNEEDFVYTYADEWNNYPILNFKDAVPRYVNCSEWDCTHIGYMKWWYSHLPKYEGINPTDNKLNNWWYYVVHYDKAVEYEQELLNNL